MLSDLSYEGEKEPQPVVTSSQIVTPHLFFQTDTNTSSRAPHFVSSTSKPAILSAGKADVGQPDWIGRCFLRMCLWVDLATSWTPRYRARHRWRPDSDVRQFFSEPVEISAPAPVKARRRARKSSLWALRAMPRMQRNKRYSA